MLTATLRHTIPLAGDARLLSADIMANGRALLMEQAADARICVRWLDESGEHGPPLLWGDGNCGDGDGYDPETDRLIIALNGPPHVFDATSGAFLGVLPDHPKPTYSVEVAPGGRVVTQSIDGQRRVFDLRTFACLARHSTRTFRGWSIPLGVLPGDPALIGGFADVRITEARAHSLRGEMVNG